MILNGREDLRKKKTVTGIHNAFIELIEKKEYAKITVVDICSKAMINKKTFYNYYANIDELLAELQQILLDEFLQKINGYKVPMDLDKINREFFLYSISKGKVYEPIMYNETYANLGKNVTRNFVSSAWKDFANNGIDKFKLNILLCFLQTVGLELYKQWVRDGKNIQAEEIIEISSELLCNGVNGFIKSIKKF